jgi:hypothetical protein
MGPRLWPSLWPSGAQAAADVCAEGDASHATTRRFAKMRGVGGVSARVFPLGLTRTFLPAPEGASSANCCRSCSTSGFGGGSAREGGVADADGEDEDSEGVSDDGSRGGGL